MTARRLNRRSFLQTTTVGTVATFAVPNILRARNLNEKLNIAVIGAGGRGRRNSQAVDSENIVALCDVYEANLNAAAERYPKARKAIDFRKLFDHEKELTRSSSAPANMRTHSPRSPRSSWASTSIVKNH